MKRCTTKYLMFALVAWLFTSSVLAQTTYVNTTMKKQPWSQLPVVVANEAAGGLQSFSTDLTALTDSATTQSVVSGLVKTNFRSTGMIVTLTDSNDGSRRYYQMSGDQASPVWIEIYLTGAWNATESYASGQPVVHGGAMFIAKQINKAVEPGVAATSEDNWTSIGDDYKRFVSDTVSRADTLLANRDSLVSQYAVARLANNLQGSIDTLQMVFQTYDSIFVFTSDTIYSSVITTDSLYSRIAQIDSIFSQLLISDSIFSQILRSDSIFSQILRSDSIFSEVARIDSIFSQILRSDSIFSQIARLDTIYSELARIDTIISNIITTDSLYSEVARLDTIYSTLANIDTIVTKQLTIDEVVIDSITNTISGTAENELVTEKAVKDYVDGQINALSSDGGTSSIYFGQLVFTAQPAETDMAAEPIVETTLDIANSTSATTFASGGYGLIKDAYNYIAFPSTWSEESFFLAYDMDGSIGFESVSRVIDGVLKRTVVVGGVNYQVWVFNFRIPAGFTGNVKLTNQGSTAGL